MNNEAERTEREDEDGFEAVTDDELVEVTAGTGLPDLVIVGGHL